MHPSDTGGMRPDCTGSPGARGGQGDGTAVLLVLLIWLAGVGAGAQFAKIAVTLPEFAARYAGHDAVIGWLVSVISLLGVVFGLFTGLLAGRIGARRLLLGSLGVGVAMSLFQSTLPPFPVMLASRLVEGICHLGIVVAAPTLIGLVSPDRWRSAAMTLWGTFFGVAFAVTAWLGLPFADAYGLAALLRAHALYLAVTGSLLALGFHRSGLPVRHVQTARPAGEPVSFVAHHARVYTSAHVGAPAAGWFFYTFTFVAILSVIADLVPPDWRHRLSIGLPLASMGASLLLGVVLLRVLPATRVVMLGFLLAAGFAVAAALAPGMPGLLVGIFAALGLVQGASFAAVPQLNAVPAEQALANGAMAQTGNLGNLLGTPVMVVVIATIRPAAVLWLLALLCVAGALVHALLESRRRRQPESH